MNKCKILDSKIKKITTKDCYSFHSDINKLLEKSRKYGCEIDQITILKKANRCAARPRKTFSLK